MTIVVGGAAVGALVLVACPKCKEPQVRERRSSGDSYTCRKCGHSFTGAEGTQQARYHSDI